MVSRDGSATASLCQGNLDAHRQVAASDTLAGPCTTLAERSPQRELGASCLRHTRSAGQGIMADSDRMLVSESVISSPAFGVSTLVFTPSR